MPHGAAVLTDGVNENRTPTLNQFGLSFSQLIRYQYDNQGYILVQKLGGYTRFYPQALPAPVVSLAAWEDTNAIAHLGYGTRNIGMTGHAQLGVITNGLNQIITPTTTQDNVTPAAQTVEGSAIVTITDNTVVGVTNFDTVYILTHLAVGGLVLFGMYPCEQLSANAYDIMALTALGQPNPAPSSSSTTVVAKFTTTLNSNSVTVTLPNHGYNVGSTYPVLISTTVGGITLFGNYIVESVTDVNNFVIYGSNLATSATNAFINGGNAGYIYSFGIGAIAPGSGYGAGGYGRGGYGVGTGITPSTGTAIGATSWTMDNWGEVFLACPISGSIFRPIYQWDPLSGSSIATVIAAGPPINGGMFVAMPQRQIIAWGSTVTGVQDPLLIRWCDVNNYDVWIPQVTNQAGSFRLTKGSKIVGGIQGPQQAYIFTDIDVWSMQYVGLPNVYGFFEIGTGCGLIGCKAVASVNGVIYWMGPSQFFTLSENGVQPLNCPIWDVMFQELDQTQVDRIRVAVNSRFNEIAWYYPTQSSGGVNTNYVKLNYALGYWDYGTLDRSAWIDQSVLGPPIGADPVSLYLYQHETSNDADGQPLAASYQTGYLAIAEGEQQFFVDQIWPDARFGDAGQPQSATLQITFFGVNYPGDTPRQYGPYTFTQGTQFITPRIRNRLLSMSVQSDDLGSFWRIGRLRYRYAPDGKY